jgi:diguanylate cyclase (GGDEF)-like protein
MVFAVGEPPPFRLGGDAASASSATRELLESAATPLGSVLGSSPEFWRDLARSVAVAADERSACAVVTREISRVLETRAWIVEKVGDHFRISTDADSEPPADFESISTAAVGVDFERRAAGGELRPIDLGRWTAIPLGDAEGSRALIVAGDAVRLEPVLGAVAVWLPSALAAVRERARRARAEALAVDTYKLARRAGRLGAVDSVCRQAAEQAARSLAAERVAVALYRSDEHRLAVVATCGYPLAEVEDVRIEPGEWVMGHVYASRRAVVVRDVRRLRALSVVTRRYRTFSFAAVPIIADRTVIGVLSATDKIDGTSFGRQDVATLRAIAGVAALGVVAARGDAEARRLARAATVDSLTGLFNRQYFDLRLHQEIERARRTSSALTVLMIDVDDFKVINDTQGHALGDGVLQAVANTLRSVVRVFDVCARYGGDEFAVVMPNSERTRASATAERIGESIARSCGRDARLAGPSLVTVSVGAAVMDAGETPEQILQRADESLYHAKAAGKNCVRIASSRRVAPLSSRAAGRSDERT